MTWMLPLSFASTQQAHGFILVEIITEIDDSFTYNYTVDNSTGDFDIFAWQLDFPGPVENIDWVQFDVNSDGQVTVPLGNPGTTDDWEAEPGTPITGLSSQEFSSLFNEVAVGEVLTGFSFNSRIAPGVINYTEFGPIGESFSGTVLGPLVIPEPATVVLMGLGLAVLFVFRRRFLK